MTGLCQCGCGQKTRLAKKTSRGRVKGQPARWRPGHNARGRSVPPAPVTACTGCGELMCHRSRADRVGVRVAVGRGLCADCYRAAGRDGTLIDHPRRLRSRDELLEEWTHFGGPTGAITFVEFARQVGMSSAAWDRAYQRARADGDPRATKPAGMSRGAA